MLLRGSGGRRRLLRMERAMSTALELYGLLVLTVLGFTLPILTVLLSLFPEGVRALSAKSEQERTQSEESIRSETDKKKTEKGLDYAVLEATLKSLKEKKRKAEVRLEYLRPNKLVLKIATPFAVAFAALLFAFLNLPLALTLLLLLASLGSFGFGLAALFTSVSVLMEVSEIVNEARRGTEETV